MVRAFGTAGVRGVFNSTQTPEQVYGLAETIAFVFGKGVYGIGWDSRKVSALLAKTVASGVNAAGSDALLFGTVPTPTVAFGSRTKSCFAGFAVTSSHNPPEFSGVKVFNRNGMELSKSEEERVERGMGINVMKASGTFGQSFPADEVVDEYVEALVSRHARVSERARIALDCACGPGGLVTPRVLGLLGHRVTPVNAQLSWRFPARLPEPTPANLADFCRAVPQLGVDFGLAHDGDADRLVMINQTGEVVPDSVMTILALRGIQASSGTVVVSENSSSAIVEEAEARGYKVVRSRVGKTFAVLEDEGGVFASEPSKVVDPSWGLWEDGINAAATISGLLANDRGLLSRTLAQVEWRYRQVNVNVQARISLLTRNAKERFKRFEIAEERTLDGYKMIFEDGSWVMFRPSGTEPKTRLYCESKDPQLLQALVDEGTRCVESSVTA
ncbi:MAG: hypothetical protein JRN24_01090 [Nitrososphaerota archaeon]|nr:hypothetical protein [Nitrososphaerota archaeon]